MTPTVDSFRPGRFFTRREKQGDDAGDVVQVVGVMPQHNGHVRLVVESATFGAVPADWDGIRVTFPPSEFAEEYTEADGAEVAFLAAEQAVVAKAAKDKDKTERLSPWAYTPPPARRTGKGARS